MSKRVIKLTITSVIIFLLLTGWVYADGEQYLDWYDSEISSMNNIILNINSIENKDKLKKSLLTEIQDIDTK